MDGLVSLFIAYSFACVLSYTPLFMYLDPTCCQFGQDPDPGTCYARARNFSVSKISSLFHPRDACVIDFFKCCVRKFEMGKNKATRHIIIYKMYNSVPSRLAP